LNFGLLRLVILQSMDLHASQIQGFFDVPVDKYVIARPVCVKS
jgi:phosphoribosylpyrophosphate synthetase